jgi:predicted cobalt transporter CbtA
MSPRTLLVRGMLVGVAAGLLAFVFASLFGEAPIGQAIAFEGAHAGAGAGEPELVTRSVQSTLGLAVAVVVYGAALGGVFAIAFAAAYGRIGRFGARGTALGVAAVAFVVVELIPFLKYPANPPAVGQPETIGRRTALYFAMIALAVAAAIAAVLVGRSLTGRLGVWNAVLLAALGFAVIVGVAGALLPSVNEVPDDFPATVLWRFRVASVGTQLVLWSSLGLLFGALTERNAERQAPAPQPVAVR